MMTAEALLLTPLNKEHIDSDESDEHHEEDTICKEGEAYVRAIQLPDSDMCLDEISSELKKHNIFKAVIHLVKYGWPMRRLWTNGSGMNTGI